MPMTHGSWACTHGHGAGRTRYGSAAQDLAESNIDHAAEIG